MVITRLVPCATDPAQSGHGLELLLRGNVGTTNKTEFEGHAPRTLFVTGVVREGAELVFAIDTDPGQKPADTYYPSEFAELFGAA